MQGPSFVPYPRASVAQNDSITSGNSNPIPVEIRVRNAGEYTLVVWIDECDDDGSPIVD